jgi:rhodanese-related sulfurtransferase
MAAGAANEMGYTTIMIYQAGMPDWASKGYPVQKGNNPGKLK